jgi:hypothetical protein
MILQYGWMNLNESTEEEKVLVLWRRKKSKFPDNQLLLSREVKSTSAAPFLHSFVFAIDEYDHDVCSACSWMVVAALS